MNVTTHHSINIQPVLGGFIVSYPVRTGEDGTDYRQEVATSLGKAMRIAKTSVEEFSLVAKDKADAE